jgi:hypothetical protein
MDPTHRMTQFEDPGRQFSLKRAFLMLSLPFALLLVFVVALLSTTDLGADRGRVALLESVERRMDGIAATPEADAAALIAARAAAEDAWDEAQRGAVRRLLERTAWPDGSRELAHVTNLRLVGAPPEQWNGDERAAVRELLDHFERYWFARPQPRR